MGKTEQNLREAFRGECEARSRYAAYADVARREGYGEIARVFCETADNEGTHSLLWLSALSGIGSTIDNLRFSVEGEGEMWEEVYERFAADAEEEGYGELAFRFRAVGRVEKGHCDRFGHLLREVCEKRVFERERESLWSCSACGYLHVGRRAPERCPLCRAERGAYAVR